MKAMKATETRATGNLLVGRVFWMRKNRYKPMDPIGNQNPAFSIRTKKNSSPIINTINANIIEAIPNGFANF